MVVTDGPARWRMLARSGRRFWIEPGFRSDKSHGWEWEASQVEGVRHQAVLLVAMAWASALAVCLGVAQARELLLQPAGGRRTQMRAATRTGERVHRGSGGDAGVVVWDVAGTVALAVAADRGSELECPMADGASAGAAPI